MIGCVWYAILWYNANAWNVLPWWSHVTAPGPRPLTCIHIPCIMMKQADKGYFSPQGKKLTSVFRTNYSWHIMSTSVLNQLHPNPPLQTFFRRIARSTRFCPRIKNWSGRGHRMTQYTFVLIKRAPRIDTDISWAAWWTGELLRFWSYKWVKIKSSEGSNWVLRLKECCIVIVTTCV